MRLLVMVLLVGLLIFSFFLGGTRATRKWKAEVKSANKVAETYSLENDRLRKSLKEKDAELATTRKEKDDAERIRDIVLKSTLGVINENK